MLIYHYKYCSHNLLTCTIKMESDIHNQHNKLLIRWDLCPLTNGRRGEFHVREYNQRIQMIRWKFTAILQWRKVIAKVDLINAFMYSIWLNKPLPWQQKTQVWWPNRTDGRYIEAKLRNKITEHRKHWLWTVD